MTPEQAQAIYFAGRDAVVTQLCALDTQVTALQQENQVLQRKIAQLSKVWRRVEPLVGAVLCCVALQGTAIFPWLGRAMAMETRATYG